MNFIRQVFNCLLMLTFISFSIKSMQNEPYFDKFISDSPEVPWRYAQEEAWHKSLNISFEEYNAAKAEYEKSDEGKRRLQGYITPSYFSWASIQQHGEAVSLSEEDYNASKIAECSNFAPLLSSGCRPFLYSSLQQFFQVYLLSRKLFNTYRSDLDTDRETKEEQNIWGLLSLEAGDRSTKAAIKEKNQQVREALFTLLQEISQKPEKPVVAFFALGCYVDFLNRPTSSRQKIIKDAQDQQFPAYLKEFTEENSAVPTHIFLIDPSFSCFRDPRDPLLVREDSQWVKTFDSKVGLKTYSKENVQIHTVPFTTNNLASTDFTKIFEFGNAVQGNGGSFIILDHAFPALFEDKAAIKTYIDTFDNLKKAGNRFQYDYPFYGLDPKREAITSIHLALP